MELEFGGKILYWRGPAPWYFVKVPPNESGLLRAMSPELTYGWGCIPVQVRLGSSHWRTSLFPKDDQYLVPIKATVRAAEDIDEGDRVNLVMTVG